MNAAGRLRQGGTMSPPALTRLLHPLSGGIQMSKLRHFVTVIAVAVMAAVGFASPAHATYPARNGLIAFSAQVNGTSQIFTVRPNGQDLQQITHTAYDAADADWSPDGRRIAFTTGIGNDCSAVALM